MVDVAQIYPCGRKYPFIKDQKSHLLLVIKVSFANIIQTVALFIWLSVILKRNKQNLLKYEINFDALTQKLVL